MSTPRKVQGYGWRPDTPDPRDRIYNLEAPIRQGDQLPAKIDLESEMPPIYDQGQLGSCTANATGALLEHQQTRQGGQPVTPARLFIYYEERRLGGLPLDQDTGAEIRDGIKVLVGDGAPPEPEWPYSDASPGPFQQKPPDSVYAEAIKHEATVYRRIVIGPGAPMRTAIANHEPIAFGFPVPAMFEGAWSPTTDMLPIPGPHDQFIGGHAVVVVGYDYTRERFPVPVFKVRNSWGAGWGERGHFYMAAGWFDPWRNLADDLWVVSHVTA